MGGEALPQCEQAVLVLLAAELRHWYVCVYKYDVILFLVGAYILLNQFIYSYG